MCGWRQVKPTRLYETSLFFRVTEWFLSLFLATRAWSKCQVMQYEEGGCVPWPSYNKLHQALNRTSYQKHNPAITGRDPVQDGLRASFGRCRFITGIIKQPVNQSPWTHRGNVNGPDPAGNWTHVHVNVEPKRKEPHSCLSPVGNQPKSECSVTWREWENVPISCIEWQTKWPWKTRACWLVAWSCDHSQEVVLMLKKIRCRSRTKTSCKSPSSPDEIDAFSPHSSCSAGGSVKVTPSCARGPSSRCRDIIILSRSHSGRKITEWFRTRRHNLWAPMNSFTVSERRNGAEGCRAERITVRLPGRSRESTPNQTGEDSMLGTNKETPNDGVSEIHYERPRFPTPGPEREPSSWRWRAGTSVGVTGPGVILIKCIFICALLICTAQKGSGEMSWEKMNESN